MGYVGVCRGTRGMQWWMEMERKPSSNTFVSVVPNRGSFESKISTGTDMNITISKK